MLLYLFQNENSDFGICRILILAESPEQANDFLTKAIMEYSEYYNEFDGWQLEEIISLDKNGVLWEAED